MNTNNLELVNSSQVSVVEFVSYTGSYPNLCSGTLTISVDGKEYEFKHALRPGGGVWFDDDWNEHVEYGPWSIYKSALPEEIQHLHNEIKTLVDEHVPEACCGGCI